MVSIAFKTAQSKAAGFQRHVASPTAGPYQSASVRRLPPTGDPRWAADLARRPYVGLRIVAGFADGWNINGSG